MLETVLVLLPALAGCFWLLDRQAQRHERELRDALNPSDLIALIDRLCQRVQAPDAAINEHAMTQITPSITEVVPMDDDDAFYGLPSKEDLADEAMTAELEARVA